MTLRRIVALTLGLSMLHLNAARADSACADHGEHSQPSTPTHHGPTHATAADVHGAATQDETCDTPTVPACCQMLASCSMVLGVDTVARVDQGGASHGAVVAPVETAPASRVTSPDPPPPKA